MLRHLRSRHPNALANETPTTEHHSATTGEGRKKELDDALINMIVKDLQPFSIMEDEGFKAFVNKLDPTYVLPTRKTVKTMEKPMAQVKNIPSVCLTADMWTSLTMESYLEVTCHYTDSNTELGSVVLGVSKFPKSHTADNIKEALSELISDWGLTGSVAAMVTDNAANMVSAIQKLGLRHLPCFAHTINLIVKRAVEEHKVMADIRSRARRVVSYFRSSTNATEKRARNASASSLGMALQQYINKRCSNVESIRTPDLRPFGNQDNAREAERLLTAECALIIQLTSEHASQAEASSSQAAQNPPSSDDLWQLLDSRVSETQRHHSCNADATIEVKRYISDAYLPRSEDPLKYWQAHKEYPHLYTLARKYLAITATSVPCERIFSKADRGFSVKGRVGLYCAQLKVPAFARQQLHPLELEAPRGRAAVRIHVERVIGLVRNKYTILQLSAKGPLKDNLPHLTRWGQFVVLFVMYLPICGPH
ncbi:E3 SUMO-protein ligase ZBED1 [Labeo rohita]|uniref:E3 SUMO-protein ligase ZBED1 n=1 Tax=Labeo rohita TaxID=84645 RepID=A0ABQ8MUG3_LABRO|nr:E3 SUMO-protein ligase ZBED1 [Labeo rohita]